MVFLFCHIRMSPPPRKSRFSAALLWLGVLAIVLHSLAGIAHMPVGKSVGGLIEFCTAQGTVKIAASTDMRLDGQNATEQADAQPRCCDLCAACSAPAIASNHAPPPFHVGFAAIGAQAPPSVIFFPANHPALTPLVPRGPPAIA
jgi:hypothetical protein